MAYVEVNDLKDYLGITSQADDGLLEDMVDRAQKIIEEYTRRVFEVDSNTTRYFDAVEDVEGLVLALGSDLCSINSVTTDADGAATALTQDTDYITAPRNETPYYALKMLSSSVYSWTYTNDPEMGIEISGKWGYSATPKKDIKHAALRLAAYLYRQKDAQVFDTVAMPDAGVMIIPQGIPADVKIILTLYRSKL